MNLMSRFNHESKREKKMKPEEKKLTNKYVCNNPNEKNALLIFIFRRRHTSSIFARCSPCVCVCTKRQKAVPHAVVFQWNILLAFFSCMYLIDTYELKTERASMLKSESMNSRAEG